MSAPGKVTRRDLLLARRALRAARYHLAMARTGLRGLDDVAVRKVAKALVGLETHLTNIRRRVGRPQAQLELSRAA